FAGDLSENIFVAGDIVVDRFRRRDVHAAALRPPRFCGGVSRCIQKKENRMKNRNTGPHHATRRIRLIVVITLATAFMVALPRGGHAQNLTPPSVPDKLQVPEGNELFLIGHAFGTQDYVCAASCSGVAFVLSTPEAVLFDNPARRVINHFFSPNPVEG